MLNHVLLRPILLTCAAALMCAPATAPAFSAERITFADWVLECVQNAGAPRSCQLRQTLTDATGRRIIQISIKRAETTAFLEAVTPLSISIPFGVLLLTSQQSSAVAAAPVPAPPPLDWTTEVKPPATATAGKNKSPGPAAGSEPRKSEAPKNDAHGDVPLQLASCDPDGCKAVVPLTPPVLDILKAAKRLAVRFQDSKSGKVLTIEASPKGLGDGAAMVLAAP